MAGEVPQQHDTMPDDFEEELTDERNMTVPSYVATEVLQSQQQSTDMFFSCCDWEDAREAEKHTCHIVKANETTIGENFSDDEEVLEKANSIQAPQSSHKMCKRKSKLARKASVGELDVQVVECQRSEHIDIDSVIMIVTAAEDTERIVSFKKYFSNRKAQRANKLT